jgi:3-methyladenine DNA glycosylase AlkD
MTPEAALDALRAKSQPGRDVGMAAYHKVARDYLGVANPEINNLVKGWRQGLSVAERIDLARDLWVTDVFEARLAAAKLLTQARLRPDTAAWELIASWVADFDSWAIADHAAMAGQRRLSAEPARLDQVEVWTTSSHMWTRRAALVFTLPWTKQNHPKPADLAVRERVLRWAAGYLDDGDWFIQKAVAWWLRDLSKHDPARVVAFLAEHGARMKPFARKEAGRFLGELSA